jgi:hypothetical protein
MSNPARPKLTDIQDRFATKGQGPSVAAIPAPAPAQPEVGEGEKDTRVQVLVRMTPQQRKDLRQIALDQDTTVQALVEETLRDFLRRHGKQA